MTIWHWVFLLWVAGGSLLGAQAAILVERDKIVATLTPLWFVSLLCWGGGLLAAVCAPYVVGRLVWQYWRRRFSN